MVTFETDDHKEHVATVVVTPVACAGATAPTPLCKPAPALSVSGKR